jgi:hypothetical protein
MTSQGRPCGHSEQYCAAAASCYACLLPIGVHGEVGAQRKEAFPTTNNLRFRKDNGRAIR